MDGADAGSSDFKEQNRAEIFSLKLGEGALIGPEIRKLIGKGDG